MKKEKLNYFKEKLLCEKEKIEKNLERSERNEEHNSIKNYYNELSSFDNHPADMGTETFEMEMNNCLEKDSKEYIKDIDEALLRIENNSYGMCAICNKKINEQRLEFMPAASNCIHCEKQGLKLNEILETRPVEEETLTSPFANDFLDKTNYNGFDGEDTLQALDRFNKSKHESLDWYNNNFDNTISGVVEETDKISNKDYKSTK